MANIYLTIYDYCQSMAEHEKSVCTLIQNKHVHIYGCISRAFNLFFMLIHQDD